MHHPRPPGRRSLPHNTPEPPRFIERVPAESPGSGPRPMSNGDYIAWRIGGLGPASSTTYKLTDDELVRELRAERLAIVRGTKTVHVHETHAVKCVVEWLRTWPGSTGERRSTGRIGRWPERSSRPPTGSATP